jgi:hypothetical protein
MPKLLLTAMAISVQDSVLKFKKSVLFILKTNISINIQDSILWRWSMLFSKTGRQAKSFEVEVL